MEAHRQPAAPAGGREAGGGAAGHADLQTHSKTSTPSSRTRNADISTATGKGDGGDKQKETGAAPAHDARGSLPLRRTAIRVTVRTLAGEQVAVCRLQPLTSMYTLNTLCARKMGVKNPQHTSYFLKRGGELRPHPHRVSDTLQSAGFLLAASNQSKPRLVDGVRVLNLEVFAVCITDDDCAWV
jgi:hypothetical protein